MQKKTKLIIFNLTTDFDCITQFKFPNTWLFIFKIKSITAYSRQKSVDIWWHFLAVHINTHETDLTPSTLNVPETLLKWSRQLAFKSCSDSVP